MTDPYRTLWEPQAYLRQYYATPHVAEDERANIAFALRQFGRVGRRFARAIEVGCGPTLHHALLIAPHVDVLHLADYLVANLEEVRRSLAGEPDSHDWGVYLSGLQAAEGTVWSDRWQSLRERVSRFAEIDVRRPQSPAYDLVASYYCAECVAGEREQWRLSLAGLAGLVAPGGVLLLAALRRCRAYHVLGRVFPTAFIDETDFAAELPALGFDSAATVIEIVPIEEWSGQGFDSICCVWAARHGSPGVAPPPCHR